MNTAPIRDRPASPRLDHIGIAVHSLAAARAVYAALGLHAGEEEVIAHERVRVAMLPLAEARLELIEPLSESSVVARFLSRHGEGLHHVALRVPDIDAEFARMQAAGVRLVSDRVQVGAGGHRYFFVHPSSAGGVLIEIAGTPGTPDAT